MWGRWRYHVVFFHCMVSRIAMSHSRVFSIGILEFLNKCIVWPSLKCLRRCLTHAKEVYVKSAWVWDCCGYHVLLFLSYVSRLAMCHSRIFSLGILEFLWQVHGSALFKVSRLVSYEGKINWLKKGVDSKLLSKSCSFLPLHRLAFSDVP